MNLRELIHDIITDPELDEGYTQVWGKGPKGKIVRRYRCTDGPKKGRIVAKPTTCSAPRNLAKATRFSRTRRSRQRSMNTRRRISMNRPTSIRVRKHNKPRPRVKMRRRPSRRRG
jgi:hypothetical protein